MKHVAVNWPTVHPGTLGEREDVMLRLARTRWLTGTLLIAATTLVTGSTTALVLVPSASAAHHDQPRLTPHGPTVNASNYTVGCSLQGNIVFSPPLNKFGGQAEKAKFTANLSNCVARPTPGGPPVTISKGTISGTLAYKDNSCTFLVISASSESFVGNLTVRWASSPALS